MLRKITFSLLLFLSSLPTFAQKTAVPEEVKLPLAIDTLASDTFSELWRLSIGTAIAREKAIGLLDQQRTILKRYCKCTVSELDDYLEGRGLPSIINRMKESNFSRKDSILWERLTDEYNWHQEFINKNEETISATREIVKERFRESFVSVSGLDKAYIGLYKLEIKHRRFVRLKEGEQPVTLDESIDSYCTERLTEVNKQIQAETEKLKQQTKARSRKPAQKKP